MTVYHPAVVDRDGRFSPSAFREVFLRSLEQHHLDVANFLFTPAPPTVLPVPKAAAVARTTMDLVLEELSDIEDDDDDEEEEEQPQLAVPKTLPLCGAPNAGRLKIVFDLDNTLLHAVSRLKLNGANIALDDFRDELDRPDLFKFTLPRQRLQLYYIKFRPCVREFIAQVAKYCDLSIHTNATREYADVVLSIIDPDRSLFGTRVAARDDDSGQNDRKDMSRLYTADRDKLLRDCLILDDRRDVWDSVFERNIIQCNYYEYFDSRSKAIAKKYGSVPAGGTNTNAFEPLVLDPLESMANSDPSDTDAQSQSTDLFEDFDRQLPFLQQMITRICQTYYNNPTELSIAGELQKQRAKILEGVVCLMTGYHRAEQPSQFGMLDNGPQHRRRLEHMGARVVDQLSDEVTHVIVMRATVTTDRARSTCSPDTKFVHGLWIYACEQTWTKVEESFFEANALLAKWPSPPPKPVFDHWPNTKLYHDWLVNKGVFPKPLNDAVRTTTSGIVPSSMSGWKTDVQLQQQQNNNGSSSRKQRRVSVSPTTDSSSSKPINCSSREWVASGIFSDGAEVWSGAEHICLKFDPFISSTLARKTSMVT